MPTLGGTFSFGGGIDDSGRVAGAATLRGDKISHAVVWDRQRLMDLKAFGGPNAAANALNDFDVVGGYAETSAAAPLGEDFCQDKSFKTCVAVAWRGTKSFKLPLLGGNNSEIFFAFNDAGLAVGTSETSTRESTCPKPQVLQEMPVVWGPGPGDIRQLPIFPGDTDGAALAINQQGTVVGASGDCKGVFANDHPARHMLLWHGGKPTRIGNVPGAPISINDRDQVVGWYGTAASPRGFLWQNGSMKDLGLLHGDVGSKAFWINDAGQIVGDSVDAKGNYRAVVWLDGAWVDMNALVPKGTTLYLLAAYAINLGGEVTGLGYDTKTKEVRGFVAIPDGGAFGPQTRQFPLTVSIPQAARERIRRFAAAMRRPIL
jgi:probable HAF family extracellular repeat protein